MISFPFSPAGWDNEKKIAILHENMHSVKPDQVVTQLFCEDFYFLLNQ